MDNSKITYHESNFKINRFNFEVSTNLLTINVIQMRDSIFIWIGNASQPSLCDISLAMKSNFTKPFCTQLFGDSLDISEGLANRLCQKLNKVIYVSYNLDVDKSLAATIEKRIFEEIAKNPDKF